MRQNSPLFCLVVVCLFSVFLTSAALGQGRDTTEGSLHALDTDLKEIGLCPLERTDVKADIRGFISRVKVTQTFRNPLSRGIEAVYTFPLPNDAAVDDMSIETGGRLIRGKILEKQQAKQNYEQAKQEGKTAVLLEQQRPNVFTQHIANIAAGAEIKVTISYVETLRYADDTYEFTFPMTIGKRYMPLETDASETENIPDTPSSERPGHTIGIEIDVDSGVPVTAGSSITHEVETASYSASKFKVRLKDAEEIPNRDFVFKYKTGGSKIEEALLTHYDERGGFFTLILQPPDKIMPADATPKEIVFVLDTSGSMSSVIDKAKESMDLILANLNPNDTFNLITFAGETRILFKEPVQATPENLAKARKLLENVSSDGGTEMMKAIRAALDPTDSQQHIRVVCFMTDGEVGNDREIIKEVQKHPNARVFSFGLGSSINHYLLDEIAREGRGEARYVRRGDNGSEAAKQFYERVRNPLLTDISIEYKGLNVSETFPARIHDLFDAQPVIITGRYTPGAAGSVILRGKMQGQPYEREIPVEFPAVKNEGDQIASLWARKKIADLNRQDPTEKTGKLNEAITKLGLEYRLLTSFTSFLAIDETPTVAPNSDVEKIVVKEAAASDNNDAVRVASTAYLPGPSATVEVVAASNSSVSTSASATATTSQVTNLPLNGRSMSSIYLTAPGTVQSGQGNIVRAGLFANGQRSTSNQYLIDGVDAARGLDKDGASDFDSIGALPDLTAAGGTNQIASDAVEELSIATFAPVKEGRTTGAVINIVTRGGTNEYHGSLFETFGNDKLNAADTFANSEGASRAPARYNNFGGTLGGYIVKDKVFHFINYEGMRLRHPVTAITEVPSIAARSAASPAFRSVLDLFPGPNRPATTNGSAGFSASLANPASHDILGYRADIMVTDDLRLTGRYNYSDSGALRRGADGTALSVFRSSDVRSDSGYLRATSTPTPYMVLEAAAGFSRASLDNEYLADTFGGAIIPAAPDNSLFNYDLAGRAAVRAGGNSRAVLDIFQSKGKLALVAGSHFIDVGADIRRSTFEIDPFTRERSVLFGSLAPTGLASRINEISRFSAGRRSITNLSAFAQDQYKISQRFVLTYGLRWDADLAPRRYTPVNTVPGASASVRNNIWNFAPRVSTAIDVTGGENAVIRLGVGRFFDLGNLRAADTFVNSYPYASGGYVRNALQDSPVASPLRPLSLFASDLKTPFAWQVFAEYQQEIARGNVISVNYAGVFGRRVLRTRTRLGADPGYPVIRFTDNSGLSDYNSLSVRYERRLSAGLHISGRYTLSNSKDNIPADRFRTGAFSTDPANNRGPSDFDVRHNFFAFGSYYIPTPFKSGLAKRLTSDWSLLAAVTARSATPVDITYNLVNDLGVTLVRPDAVSGIDPVVTTNGVASIDRSAFSIPASLRQGSYKRNSLRGFPLFQTNLALERKIKFGSETALHLRAEAFNIFNQVNYENMNGDLGTLFQDGSFVSNHYFGRSLSTLGSGSFSQLYLFGGPRTVQLSARFSF